MGKNFWRTITTGLQRRYWSDMYRNRIKYFSNKLILTAVLSNRFIFERVWNFCSLLTYWSKIFWFYFAVYIQLKTFIFWNSITPKSWSSIFGKKSLSGLNYYFIYCNSTWNDYIYSHRVTNNFPIIKYN